MHYCGKNVKRHRYWGGKVTLVRLCDEQVMRDGSGIRTSFVGQSKELFAIDIEVP